MSYSSLLSGSTHGLSANWTVVRYFMVRQCSSELAQYWKKCLQWKRVDFWQMFLAHFFTWGTENLRLLLQKKTGIYWYELARAFLDPCQFLSLTWCVSGNKMLYNLGTVPMGFQGLFFICLQKILYLNDNY